MLGDEMSRLSDVAQFSIDACTLNNVFNAVQLAILVALLRWVRRPPP